MARDPERKKKSRRDEEAAEPVNIEKELSDLASAWDEAEDKGDSFGDLPDGTYQAKLTKATIGKSQSSGRLQIAWEFTIISGDLKNRKKWAYDGLETKENMDYVKTRLARLDVDVEKLKIGDLPEALEGATNTTCEIKIKTRGDFQNTYVQKVIDIDDVEEGGDSDADDWKPSKRSRDEDEDDEPKKSKKRDEDDDEAEDDDEPKSKKKSRDEDEDESDDDEPKSKKRDRDEDEDEDEDDEPKKSKKSRDEDEDEEDEDDEPKSKKKSKDKDEDDDEDERPAKKKSTF